MVTISRRSRRDRTRRSSLQSRPAEAVEGLGQLRPMALSTAGALDEDPVAAGGGDLVDLEVGGLIDSRVAEGLLHGSEAYQNPTAAWG